MKRKFTFFVAAFMLLMSLTSRAEVSASMYEPSPKATVTPEFPGNYVIAAKNGNAYYAITQVREYEIKPVKLSFNANNQAIVSELSGKIWYLNSTDNGLAIQSNNPDYQHDYQHEDDYYLRTYEGASPELTADVKYFEVKDGTTDGTYCFVDAETNYAIGYDSNGEYFNCGPYDYENPANNTSYEFYLFEYVVPTTFNVIVPNITNGKITVSQTHNVPVGAQVTVTATPNEGCRLVDLYYQYYDRDHFIDIIDNPTFNMPAIDVVLNAVFAEIPYLEVTFNSNGKTETQQVEEGTAIGTLPNPLMNPEGYAFYGWSQTEVFPETSTEPEIIDALYIPNNDITLYAVYSTTVEGITNYTTSVPYNISIAEVIGNGSISSAASAYLNDEVTVNVSADAHYRLLNLYYTIDGDATSEHTAIDTITKKFIMPADDITIGATFEAIQYCTATFSVNTNGTENTTMVVQQTVQKGRPVGNLPVLPDGTVIPNGYSFVGWSTAGVSSPCNPKPSSAVDASYVPTGDFTLYALFAIVPDAPGEWEFVKSGFFAEDDAVFVTIKKDGNIYALSHAANPVVATNINEILPENMPNYKWNIIVENNYYYHIYPYGIRERWLCFNGSNLTIGTMTEYGDVYNFTLETNTTNHFSCLYSDKYICLDGNNQIECYSYNQLNNVPAQQLGFYRILPPHAYTTNAYANGNSYNINIAEGITNGSLTSYKKAFAGEVIQVSAAPWVGLGLETLSYNIEGQEDPTSIDIAARTFTMPAADVTLNATFAAAYTITFKVFDEIISYKEIPQGSAIGAMPVVDPALCPEDVIFAGWSEQQNATNGSYLCNENTVPTYDMDLYAMFTTDSPWDPVDYRVVDVIDNVVLTIRLSNGNYYAMSNNCGDAAPQAALFNPYSSPLDPDYEWGVFIESVEEYGPGLILFGPDWNTADEDKFMLHFNNAEDGVRTMDRVYEGSYNQKFEADGYYLKNVDYNGVGTGRYLGLDLQTMTFKTYAAPLEGQGFIIFRKSYDLLSSEIIALQEDVTISKEVTWRDPVSLNGHTLTIKDGGFLEADFIANNDPSKIIIEEGGQLKCNNSGVKATVKKHISAISGSSGWYTIASPILNRNPLNETNILSNTYDLYQYDEPSSTWLNQKAHPDDFDNLINGVGYLYANSEDTELSFSGYILDGDKSKAMPVYNESDAGVLSGFNLLGNPFTYNVWVSGGRDLSDGGYRIVGGSELTTMTELDAVKPCEGFLMQCITKNAHALIDWESFQKGGESKQYIGFEVLNSEGKQLDNAYIKVGEGNGLNKIYLHNGRELIETPRSSATSIYFTQNNQNYAIAVMEEECEEMPLYFKAGNMGKYIINMKEINIECDYMHLIDNFAGVDIDLLADGSYSFIGSPSDDINRFVIRFKPKKVDDNEANGINSDTFAYYYNGNIVINNIDGQAEIDIFDIQGRIVKTYAAAGSINENITLSSGVYVIRLIDNSGVHTQKFIAK